MKILSNIKHQKKMKNFCWAKIFINFGIYKYFWSKISGYFIIKNFE